MSLVFADYLGKVARGDNKRKSTIWSVRASHLTGILATGYSAC